MCPPGSGFYKRGKPKIKGIALCPEVDLDPVPVERRAVAIIGQLHERDRVLRSRLDEMAQMAKAEALELPVERLLRRLNDTSLDERYKDTLAIAVAPYCSPRLSALAVVKRPAQWSDQELQQVLVMTEEDLLRLGENRDHWPAEVIDAER
jgi:hypothetical protein